MLVQATTCFTTCSVNNRIGGKKKVENTTTKLSDFPLDDEKVKFSLVSLYKGKESPEKAGVGVGAGKWRLKKQEHYSTPT